MAGVLDQLVLLVVQVVREAAGEGRGPDDGVVHRELVLEPRRADPREPLGQDHVGTRPAERRPCVEVGRLDHQRVVVPAALRAAEPRGELRSVLRPRRRRDHPRLVDHLLLNRDEAGALVDLQAVVVDPREHHRRQPARDAADERRRLLRTRDVAVGVAGAIRGDLSGTALALRRQRRDPAVGRVDDHRHLRGRRVRVVPQGRVAPLALVAPDAAEGAALAARRRLLRRQRLDVGQVLRPFERDAVRGVAGPDTLQVGFVPRRARGVVGLGHVHEHRCDARRVHAREAGFDHRQSDVVGRVDEGAPRRGPAVLRHDGLLLELDAGGAQLGGGGIDVVDHEADVVDGPTLGGGRRALGVLGSEDPDASEPHAFVLVRVHGPFTAEHLLVPGEGRLRIARAQVDVVEADVRLILHQLDPGAPRIEDVAVQVAAGCLAQRRAAGEALQPHAGASDADRF